MSSIMLFLQENIKMIEIKQVLQLYQPHMAQVPEVRKYNFQWKVPSLTGGDVILF